MDAFCIYKVILEPYILSKQSNYFFSAISHNVNIVNLVLIQAYFPILKIGTLFFCFHIPQLMDLYNLGVDGRAILSCVDLSLKNTNFQVWEKKI